MLFESYPTSENRQRERHFLVNFSFNIPVLKNIRLKDVTFDDPNFEVIKLSKYDIITIKLFQSMKTSDPHAYLVCYYRDEEKIECGYETSLSIGFIKRNERLFEEVTESFSRELKINKILE